MAGEAGGGGLGAGVHRAGSALVGLGSPRAMAGGHPIALRWGCRQQRPLLHGQFIAGCWCGRWGTASLPLDEGCSVGMVTSLVDDVSLNDLQFRVTNRKDSVARLPREAVDVEGAGDEGGRDDLQVTYQVGHARRGVESHQHMNVILDASDRDRHAVPTAAKAAKEPVNARRSQRVEHRPPPLRRPHQMNIQPRVHCTHDALSS